MPRLFRKSARRSVLFTPQSEAPASELDTFPAIGYYTSLPTKIATLARSNLFQVASPIHALVSPK